MRTQLPTFVMLLAASSAMLAGGAGRDRIERGVGEAEDGVGANAEDGVKDGVKNGAQVGKAKLKSREVVREFNRVYCQRGEKKLTADVYRPHGDGPFPAIVMIHGGAWMSGSKWNVIEHANLAARRGFVVVAINYRLAPKHTFPAQIDDCRAAVRWMRKESDELRIDPKRIAAYGYSAGGHLACLLALSASHPKSEDSLVDTRVTAVVAGGAPCDFRQLGLDDSKLAYFLGGTRREQPESYRLASASTFASAAAPPVHFFHGSRDGLVPIVGSRRLHDQLKTIGASVSYDEVKGKGHLATFFDRDAASRAIGFLDEHLQPEKAAPAK